MREMSVNRFRKHLREAVEGVLQEHDPLRVTRRGGGDFVVVGAEDWEREQETLYVLQNRSLMEQIGRSAKTHAEGKSLQPPPNGRPGARGARGGGV
jgi:antitoxin YefM